MNPIKLLLGPINKFLDGKKTLIGKVSATLTGLAAVVGCLADGDISQPDMVVIGGAFSAIMLAWGLSHKVEKLTDLVKK